MPYNPTPNYSKIVLRTFHATPKTVVLRECEGIHNSQQRFPKAADVRSGTIFGPGQFEQQAYLTGTMTSGGGGGTTAVPVVS